MITTPFETAPWGFPISNRRTASRENLWVRETDAQTFALLTFETEAVSSGISRVRLAYEHRNPLIKHNYSETRELSDLLILLNSVESTESDNSMIFRKRMFKHLLANLLILPQTCTAGSREGEQYSGSPEHNYCLGSSKEKGSTANAALWDDCLINHEENQHYPVLDCGRIAEIYADNQPSLRGEACRLQVTHCHPQNPSRVAQTLHAEIIGMQNHTGISGEVRSPDKIGLVTYENFVGQSFGSSFAFLRWRRLISPSKAVVTNCPVLSPGSLIASIKFATSCGTLAAIVCDLALDALVAIPESLHIRCSTVWHKKILIQCLTCSTPVNNMVFNTLSVSWCDYSDAPEWWNTTEASNHNVTRTYTMALIHSTQTRPEKHLWRFLALDRADMNAIPRRISVEAPTEHDARQVLAPYFILSLAARLPAQGVCNA